MKQNSPVNYWLFYHRCDIVSMKSAASNVYFRWTSYWNNIKILLWTEVWPEVVTWLSVKLLWLLSERVKQARKTCTVQINENISCKEFSESFPMIRGVQNMGVCRTVLQRGQGWDKKNTKNEIFKWPANLHTFCMEALHQKNAKQQTCFSLIKMQELIYESRRTDTVAAHVFWAFRLKNVLTWCHGFLSS